MIKLAFISGLCGRKEPLFKDFQFFLQLFLCKTLRLVCVRMIFTVIISIEHCSSQEDLKQLHINIHVYSCIQPSNPSNYEPFVGSKNCQGDTV